MNNFNYDPSDEPIENTESSNGASGRFDRNAYRLETGKITTGEYAKIQSGLNEFQAEANDITNTPLPFLVSALPALNLN